MFGNGRVVAIGRDDARSRTDRRVGKTRKALKEALTGLSLEQATRR